ncbi:MAG: class I SAM-dependent methyltransferase [Candidatus Hydrogenedentota bacterium]|nr:MAG: class I SAM-dependent methyltransferase [Candidatus Hydrogenedentota bacterium]
MINYDKIASAYERHRQAELQVLTSLLSTSGIESESKVLEVGCGSGNYIVAMAGGVGCSCWGIDPSARMLSKAGERSRKIAFTLGKAEKIDLMQDFFDFVFSVDAIHHVGDRLAYFREAYRVLRAGGKVCTVTETEWMIRHRRPLAVYFPETVEVDLARYPRIPELREAMEQAGFSEVTENKVETAKHLTDIQAFREKAFSSLHPIPEEAFQRGIGRMEEDLRAGPIRCVSHYLLIWGTK